MFSSDFKIRIIEGIKNSDLIVHIGISGWSSFHEEDVLYPHQLPSRQELDCYTQHYQTKVFNSTYYRWSPNATFAFLAIAPPARISDDRKSAPWSLRTPSIFTRQSRSHPRVGKSGATCVRLLQQRRRGKCSSERFWAKNFCGERYFLTDSA